MNTTTPARRDVPSTVWNLPLGQRIRWARVSAKLSHDRLIAAMGRSNRGHLIKIEKGKHIPGSELRDVIADATNVPRDLFREAEDDEEDHQLARDLLAVIRRIKSNAPTALSLIESAAGASTERNLHDGGSDV